MTLSVMHLSPQQKYSKMMNGKDFSKLDNGRLGAIYLPIYHLQYLKKEQDLQYKRLLQKQSTQKSD